MSVKTISRLGDWIPKDRIRCVNRTGAALERGDVCALDLTGSDGDVNTYAEFIADTTPDPQASPLANVIDPATAHLTGWIFVVATGPVADNAVGEFILSGLAEVKVTAGAVVKGDKLMPANGVNTTLKTTDGKATVAIALEVNDSAAALIWTIFDGWAMNAAGAAS